MIKANGPTLRKQVYVEESSRRVLMWNWLSLRNKQFKPRLFGDRDVDLQIECCGVCGSDVHKINGGFGPSPLPIAVGHEVVGRAVKVGAGVTTLKVGDRVGVGAQIWSCLNCPQCKSDNENYCPHLVGSYHQPCLLGKSCINR
jgi:alcohol dehydrogenase (NADP+)